MMLLCDIISFVFISAFLYRRRTLNMLFCHRLWSILLGVIIIMLVLFSNCIQYIAIYYYRRFRCRCRLQQPHVTPFMNWWLVVIIIYCIVFFVGLWHGYGFVILPSVCFRQYLHYLASIFFLCSIVHSLFCALVHCEALPPCGLRSVWI